jgi:DNA-binding winged helix-turn-helix (wHTH) protein
LQIQLGLGTILPTELPARRFRSLLLKPAEAAMKNLVWRFRSGEFDLIEHRQVLLDHCVDREVKLKQSEVSLLSVLIKWAFERHGETVPYAVLKEAIGAIRTEEVHTVICKLRDKLHGDIRRELIETVSREGYRFNAIPERIRPTRSIPEYLAKDGRVEARVYRSQTYDDWRMFLQNFEEQYIATRYVLGVSGNEKYKAEVVPDQKTARDDGKIIKRFYLYDSDPIKEYGELPELDGGAKVYASCIPKAALYPEVEEHINTLGGMLDFALVDRRWLRIVEYDEQRQPGDVLIIINDQKMRHAAEKILDACERLASKAATATTTGKEKKKRAKAHLPAIPPHAPQRLDPSRTIAAAMDRYDQFMREHAALNPVVHRLFDDVLLKAARQLNQLGKGLVEFHGESWRQPWKDILNLPEVTSYRSVFVVNSNDCCNDEDWQDCIEFNKKHVKDHKMTIERIFIIDSKSLWGNDDIRDWILEQKKGGITIAVISKEVLLRYDEQDLVRDFGIYGHVAVGYWITGTNPKENVFQMHFSPEEYSYADNVYKKLRSYATDERTAQYLGAGAQG